MSEELEIVDEKKIIEETKKASKAKAKASASAAPKSAIESRAAAIDRKLGSNEGQQKTKGEPSPVAQTRGAAIAARFVARTERRSS